MRRHGDPRDDALDVAPLIEQRRQRGPALLVHAVALVEDAHPAAHHRRDQRRGVIGDLAVVGENRRDDEVLGARVGGALIDVQILVPVARRSHAQRRLADPGHTLDARHQRQVGVVDDEPTRQQLPQNLFLPDPLADRRIRTAEHEAHAVHFGPASLRPGFARGT